MIWASFSSDRPQEPVGLGWELNDEGGRSLNFARQRRYGTEVEIKARGRIK